MWPICIACNLQGRATQPSLPEREMGQLFKEHQIALGAAATADFKALLNEVRFPPEASSQHCKLCGRSL